MIIVHCKKICNISGEDTVHISDVFNCYSKILGERLRIIQLRIRANKKQGNQKIFKSLGMSHISISDTSISDAMRKCRKLSNLKVRVL